MRQAGPDTFRQATQLRRRVLTVTIGLSLAWSLIVVPLGLLDILPFGPAQSLNNVLLLIINAALFLVIRKHPEALALVGAGFFATVFYVAISAQFFAVNDYLRPLLLFPCTGAVFLIFGAVAGWTAVAVSLCGFGAAVAHGNLPANPLGISTFLLTLCTTAILFHLFRHQAITAVETIEAQNAALDKTSREDPLTSLLNLRAFRQAMQTWEAGDTPFAVAFLDIDHFKSINDRYGHDGGDALLVAFARRLTDTVRPQDIIARIGGEEFAVLMPCADRAEAERLGERLRTSIATARLELDGDELTVTASIGIAMSDSVAGANPLKVADSAMYLAKRCGRNRVVMASGRELESGEPAAAGH